MNRNGHRPGHVDPQATAYLPPQPDPQRQTQPHLPLARIQPHEVQLPPRETWRYEPVEEQPMGLGQIVVAYVDEFKQDLQAGLEVKRLRREQRLVEQHQETEQAKQRAFRTRMDTVRLGMEAQQLSLEAEALPVQTALRLRREIAEQKLQTFEAELGEKFLRQVRSLPQAEAAALLQEENDVERLLVEREALKQQRRMIASSTNLVPRDTAAGAAALESGRSTAADGLGFGAPVEVTLSQQDIESLALNGVIQHAKYSTSQERDAWLQQWRHKLRQQLAPYTADEVIARFSALQNIAAR